MNSLLLYAGQLDLGFMLLQGFEKLGLVWEIQVPQNLPLRAGISPVTRDAALAVRSSHGIDPAV